MPKLLTKKIIIFLSVYNFLNSGPLELQLIKAAQFGKEEELIKMIKASSNSDLSNLLEVDEYDKDALFYATENGFLDAAELILKLNAHININRQDSMGRTILHWAVISKNSSLIDLLISNNADLNITDNNLQTPLILAILQKNNFICESLLFNDAKTEIFDIEEKNALIIATELNQLTIVQQLINCNSNLDVTDKNGNTPLMIAIKKNYIEIVENLLDYGADIYIGNHFNESCLDIAKQVNESILALIYFKLAENNILLNNKYGIKKAAGFYEKVLQCKVTEKYKFLIENSHFNLGLIYFEDLETSLELSLHYFNNVITEDVNLKEKTKLYKGLIYLKTNKQSEAFNLLISMEPKYLNNDESSLRNFALADILNNKGNHLQAIIYLKREIETSNNINNISSALIKLGEIYIKKKRILSRFKIIFSNFKIKYRRKDKIFSKFLHWSNSILKRIRRN